MKRIIIPAGTVSGKKDYILEIPVDSYDDENAIYILDDKSSRGSVKSLSDYFYDKGSRSQLSAEYSKQYLYQKEDPQNAHMYPNHSNHNIRASYSPNHMLKNELSSGNYHPVENPTTQNPSDISQMAKYYYYKSLGFTESELHKLLAKNNGQQKITEVPSQRKQMRFNRMGVAEFSSLYEDPTLNFYQYDSPYQPFNVPTGKTYVNAHENMMSNTTQSNIPFNASTNLDRNQGYYEEYPKEKQTRVHNIDAGMYKQYVLPPRSTVPTTKNNAVKTKQSYTSQQNATSIPVSNQQIQNAYHQNRYYAKPVSTPKAACNSKTAVTNNTVPNQSTHNGTTKAQDAEFENASGTISADGSFQTSAQMRSYQKLPNGYSRPPVHPQKRIYRTIPGTSVVSNVPSIRIRKPIAS